jgi:hypothetical protein
MFIALHYQNNARSIGAQCRHEQHFAPNGAKPFAWRPGYKHVAPPEQKIRSAKHVTAVKTVSSLFRYRNR